MKRIFLILLVGSLVACESRKFDLHCVDKIGTVIFDGRVLRPEARGDDVWFFTKDNKFHEIVGATCVITEVEP